MVIDVGEAEILKGQLTKPLDSAFDIDVASLYLFQEFSNFARIHGAAECSRGPFWSGRLVGKSRKLPSGAPKSSISSTSSVPARRLRIGGIRFVGEKVIAVLANQPIRSAKPHETELVLGQGPNAGLGQAIFQGQVGEFDFMPRREISREEIGQEED